MYQNQIAHRNRSNNSRNNNLAERQYFADGMLFGQSATELPVFDMPDVNGVTILVVDDEEPLRNLLKVSLERSGFNVISACDGKSALELFAAYSIDMVLLDVIMPNMDGFCCLCRVATTVGCADCYANSLEST